MKLKKLEKKISKLVEEAYWKGWSDGWDKCDEENLEDTTTFEEGWAARGENVLTRMKMLEEGYLIDGKGSKAIMVREIAELLAFEFKREEENDNND